MQRRNVVSRETSERIDHFCMLFRKWNKTTNLVAPSTLPSLESRHVLDSLQIWQMSPDPKTWIDLGSGGGFPGVITAICLAEGGAGWVHLVESNKKKAAFLRIALAETGARGTVHPVRIEDAVALVPSCQAISARALADLTDLLVLCEPWMLEKPSVAGFFHKGREYRSEVQNARGRFDFDLVEHQSAIEPDSAILEISNLTRLKT